MSLPEGQRRVRVPEPPAVGEPQFALPAPHPERLPRETRNGSAGAPPARDGSDPSVGERRRVCVQ